MKTAVTYHKQAIALELDLAVVYCNLGSILQKHGQWEEAITSYDQALKLNPQNGKIYSRLNQVYQAQNNITEAIFVYDQGLTLLNPHYAKAVSPYQNVAITQEMLAMERGQRC
ncbi:MAG: tetratricopeptide repeat protein [Nostoc sp.]|uniref:tetratricopeptide repeat protein n=1 Tax=Nostoc sp. TaxID=1180 RepID=UPI002FF7E1DE